MPTIKSAEKRLRQSERRRARNKSVRSRIRTRAKKIREMDSADEARRALDELYALLDRAASKGIIHSNKAARKKSQMARYVEELES